LKENWISDGDGDLAVVDEGDDVLSSDDPCSSPDDVFSQVPPPDISERRCFGVSGACVSQISLMSARDESI
jgi:hypothetical protein